MYNEIKSQTSMGKTTLANAKSGSMDWNAIVIKDKPETVILPEGDYNFTVMSFERGRFAGSDRISPCNKAVMMLAFTTEDGKVAKVKVELLLHSVVEWKLASFFRSIGQKKRGEAIEMHWDTVEGARGRAHVKPRTYATANGEERTVNDVAYFIDYEEKYFETVPELMVEVDEIPF